MTAAGITAARVCLSTCKCHGGHGEGVTKQTVNTHEIGALRENVLSHVSTTPGLRDGTALGRSTQRGLRKDGTNAVDKASQ